MGGGGSERIRARWRPLCSWSIGRRDGRESQSLCRGRKAMKPIKVAIIGFGKIAADQHLPSIQANDRFELVASSSRSGQGAARTFTDWRDMIRSVDGLEAVAITTPPEPRYEIARA